MPKQSYTPTESDRLTGARVRQLRKLAGETLQQTIDRSGINIGQASLSRVELGQRHLSNPEATKLAAHFNTTVEKIRVTAPAPVETEQAWLGNERPKLAAVPEVPKQGTFGKSLVIDLDAPLTVDEYREQVWIPYLENRYAADLKATG